MNKFLCNLINLRHVKFHCCWLQHDWVHQSSHFVPFLTLPEKHHRLRYVYCFVDEFHILSKQASILSIDIRSNVLTIVCKSVNCSSIWINSFHAKELFCIINVESHHHLWPAKHRWKFWYFAKFRSQLPAKVFFDENWCIFRQWI